MDEVVIDTDITPRKSPPRKPRDAEDFDVCPFTVLVDTREQANWGFRGIRSDANKGGAPLIVKTERRGLKTGDYSIDGHEGVIAIERKEKGDLFHCMGADRERFEEQVRRLSELQFGFVIVEADWDSIFKGHANSQLLPKVIHRTVISWGLKYPSVHWFLMPTRESAEATCFRVLEKYWRNLEL